MTIAAITHGTAVLAYLLLTVLLVTAWRGRLMGLFAVAAIVATLIWAAVGVTLALGVTLPDRLPVAAELVRNGTWFLFLTRILDGQLERTARRLWQRAAWLVIAAAATLTLLGPALAAPAGLIGLSVAHVTLLGWILQALFGLLLVEQVFRNRPPKRRWEIKHLCLGLGAVFAYDLFFYSDALLIQRIDPHLWAARGLVNALIVPLIAVSAARNPSWSLDVHVSRQVVLHSATLTGAGLYLMAMAAVGYYIQFAGGTWGAVLQIAFLFTAGVLLLILLFSGHLRAKLRVLVNRHFFTFKYDYRDEWLRFTEALSRDGLDLPVAVVTALGRIVDSPGGILWLRTEVGTFELARRVALPEPSSTLLPADDPLVAFLTRTGWVVDLDEYEATPELYRDMESPDWLVRLPAAWLIIPLVFRGDLCGLVVLARSRIRRSINWEDRSLLKTAGRQAATLVAQYLADQALMRARQFEAFSQLSAYVAHDLKNLLAQQTLLLANAERHKHNPAFIEDVFGTIRSSVERMTRLMAQLRDGVRGEDRARLPLDQVIREAAAAHAHRRPAPRVEDLPGDIAVLADRDRLRTVFGHLIQNAQEATGPEGEVRIRVRRDGAVALVEIEDDGVGMSAEFIRDRLFRPFDSTKGLTGMGIGAFESREFVRLLGGELEVSSVPGRGSCFRIRLPCAEGGEVAEDPRRAESEEVVS